MASLNTGTLPNITEADQDNVFLLTTEALVDKLFLCLAGAKETIIVKENCNKEITVRKYYRQSRELLKWIPIAGADSPFIIYLSDLTPQIKQEFDELEVTTVRYILTQAVSRLFENLDFEYYHLSTARKIKVRLEK
jgi:hypothetical protein